MRETLTPLIALFIALAALLAGNGLQSTLIAVRANLEGFPITVIGSMMSAYFVGYILGCIICPIFVRQVGHIRTFAALASIVSSVALIHLVLVNPWVWVILRVVTGACFAGLAMIAESWINERASNTDRGRIIAVYRVVDLGAVTIGQLLFALADPGGFALFCLVSILISLALVPVSLTTSAAPKPIARTKLDLKKVFNVSPLAAIGVFGAGLASSAFWGLGPVFIQNAGYSTNTVAVFMSSVIIGGVVAQFPLGLISDRFDRRHLMNLITLASAVTGAVLALTAHTGLSAILISGFFYGAFTLSIYSLAIAHANDFAGNESFVEVSRALLMLFGIGAAFGPYLGALSAQLAGNPAIFLYTSAVYGIVCVYGVYRTFQRPTVPVTEQVNYVPIPRSSPEIYELDPRADNDNSAPTAPPTTP